MHVNVQLRTDIKATYDIKQIECNIGSSKNAQIVLKDDSIYPEHAMFTRFEENIYITPFSERTEVYLNANRIKSPHILKGNDIINIGHYSLIVRSERENGLINKVLFIKINSHKFTKLLITIIVIIGIFSGIFIIINKIPPFYRFDSDKTFQVENRQIRIKNAIEDAQKVLDSKSLTGYEESVIELSDVLNELMVLGIEPSNQIKMREVLNDLEKRKRY